MSYTLIKTWVFDQSARVLGLIYVIINNDNNFIV